MTTEPDIDSFSQIKASSSQEGTCGSDPVGVLRTFSLHCYTGGS